ncbi:MAG: hypothetical protein K2L51_05140, partial [Clostridiales bacterium]|nr:hypothetical protein [Clostridiales bacterium]
MKKKFVDFLKADFIVWAFLSIAVLMELTGVCVTSGKFFIRNPLMFFSVLAVFTCVLFAVKNQKGRYWCALAFLLVIFAIDLGFIVV